MKFFFNSSSLTHRYKTENDFLIWPESHCGKEQFFKISQAGVLRLVPCHHSPRLTSCHAAAAFYGQNLRTYPKKFD